MTNESLRRIWTAHLSGGQLSPEEERDLIEALKSSAETREALLFDLDLHRTLHAWGRSERDAPHFLRAFSRGSAAQGDATRFIQKVNSRIENIGIPEPERPGNPSQNPEGSFGPRARGARASTPRGSAIRPRGALVPALVAAAGFIAVLLFFALTSSTQAPSGPSRNDRPRQVRNREGKGDVESRAERIRGEGEDRPHEKEAKQKDVVPLGSKVSDLPPAERSVTKEATKDKDQDAPGPKEQLQATKPDDKGKASEPPKEEKSLQPLAPSVKPEGRTLTTVAILEEVTGQAFVLDSKGKGAAAPGAGLVPGRGLQTVGKPSRVVLRFPDKTRVELGPDTLLRDIGVEGGKRLTLEAGVLSAEVSRQPEQEPMVVSTPHGAVKVLGTTFRLLVDLDPRKGTRLEVDEGKVELRNLLGAQVEVTPGQYAVAQAGIDLVARSLPTDEIVLLPKQALLVGNEWALIKDRAASSGTALYSRETAYKIRSVGTGHVYDGVRNRSAYLLFSFQAEADKDYHLWMRGRSLPEDPKHLFTSELAVEPANAQLSLADGQAALAGDNAYSYTGFFHFPGYGWIGGRGELAKGDAVPLSIRFSRSGPQTLKIYVLQAPTWLDAVWLSATQKTRPEAGQTGPAKK